MQKPASFKLNTKSVRNFSIFLNSLQHHRTTLQMSHNIIRTRTILLTTTIRSVHLDYVTQNCNSKRTLKPFSAVPAVARLSSAAHCPAQAQAQQKTDVLGVKINYQKVGKGSHPIICIPGALGFIESDFGPLLTKFPLDKFTIVAWDPPGYGKSRPPDRDFSGGAQFFHRDALFADTLMKNLGFSKYSVLGWSDGGITGLIQAAKFPTSVQALAVWGSNAYIAEEDVKLYEMVRDINKWSAKMKAPMIEMYGEDYFRKFWCEWVDTFQLIFKNGGDLCKNDLKNIKCPTLIIHGLKDPMVPTFHAEYLQKNIINSKLVVLPKAKHNLHLRYADEFMKMIEKFLLSKV